MKIEAPPSSRYSRLDGLRGIAALIVVFHHCLLAFPLWDRTLTFGPPGRMTALFTYSPLHLLWAGHVAVLIFFALSGFVLTLMLTRTPPMSYFAFAMKRVCRIYVPYFVILAIAIVLMSALHPHGDPSLSSWFNSSWSGGISRGLLADQAFMFGANRYNYIDNPAWSLVHEMRYSLVFPAILWLTRRLPWRLAIAGSLGATLVFRAACGFQPDNTVLDSLQYLFVFAGGSVLAVHRDIAREWYSNQRRSLRFAFVTAAVLLLSSDGLLFLRSHAVRAAVFLATQLGSVVLLLCVVGARRPPAILESRPVLWLGRISYSLYLSHVVVLLTLVYALKNVFRSATVIAFVPAAALLTAEVLYRLIERPAMALGQQLQQRIDRTPEPAHVPIRVSIPVPVRAQATQPPNRPDANLTFN